MGIPVEESSIERRLWTLGGLLGILALGLCLFLWQLARRQEPLTHGVLPFQVLQTHINAIATSLFAYGQTHEGVYLNKVREEGEETAESLGRCLRQTANPSQATQLTHLMDSLRGATLAMLTAQTSQSEALNNFFARLDEAGQTLEQNAGTRTQRKTARNAARSLLSGDASLSVAGKDLALFLYSGTPEALGAYKRSERNAVALFGDDSPLGHGAWADKVSASLKEAWRSGDQALGLQKDKGDALAEYQRAQKELSQLLLVMSASSSSGREVLPSTILWAAAVTGALLLAGIFTLMVFLRRQMIRPLATLAMAAEAAAAGDLSREYKMKNWDEISRVGLAFNRVTKVLARSENLIYHLATLVESTGEAIVSFTLEGTILSWNRGAQRIYGYTADEMKNRAVTLLAPKRNPKPFQLLLQSIKRGEKMKPFEMTHEGKSGRTVQVFVRVACIYDSTRQIIGASLCLQDLPKTQPLVPRAKDAGFP
jgi:PAS domain S-box-containing protein